MTKKETTETTIANPDAVAPNAEVSVITETKDVAVSAPLAGTVFAGLDLGGGFKIVGAVTVTRPVLKQADGVPFAVRFDGAIFESKIDAGKKKAGETVMAPAMVAYVTDLQTGEECTLICNAALTSGLTDMYPDDGYVGRAFACVSKLRPHDGGKKQIREYAVRELIIERS